MYKLKLNLEQLAVETFDTGTKAAGSGTVEGFSAETQDDAHTCGPQYSVYAPEMTCDESCAPTYCQPTGGSGGMTGPLCP